MEEAFEDTGEPIGDDPAEPDLNSLIDLHMLNEMERAMNSESLAATDTAVATHQSGSSGAPAHEQQQRKKKPSQKKKQKQKKADSHKPGADWLHGAANAQPTPQLNKCGFDTVNGEHWCLKGATVTYALSVSAQDAPAEAVPLECSLRHAANGERVRLQAGDPEELLTMKRQPHLKGRRGVAQVAVHLLSSRRPMAHVRGKARAEQAVPVAPGRKDKGTLFVLRFEPADPEMRARHPSLSFVTPPVRVKAKKPRHGVPRRDARRDGAPDEAPAAAPRPAPARAAGTKRARPADDGAAADHGPPRARRPHLEPGEPVSSQQPRVPVPPSAGNMRWMRIAPSELAPAASFVPAARALLPPRTDLAMAATRELAPWQHDAGTGAEGLEQANPLTGGGRRAQRLPSLVREYTRLREQLFSIEAQLREAGVDPAAI